MEFLYAQRNDDSAGQGHRWEFRRSAQETTTTTTRRAFEGARVSTTIVVHDVGPELLEERSASHYDVAGAARDPMTVYMLGVRPASERAVRTRLGMLARVAQWSGPVAAFPWDRLEPAHVRALSVAVGAEYAPDTARAVIVALRGVLRACWTCRRYSLEEFERRAAEIVAPHGERGLRGRALSPAECARMFSQANLRDRAMIALLFGAGLRRSEAAALTWGEIADSAVRTIGKGNKERVVPLKPWACKALQAWRDAYASPADTDRVLRAWRGRHGALGASMTASGVYHALRSLAGRVGVHNVAPHDARRTYISELLDVTDTVTASKLAGHASTAQTARYDRRGERALRDAVGALRSIVEDERS